MKYRQSLFDTRTLPCKQVIICQLLHGYKTSIYVSLLFYRKGQMTQWFNLFTKTFIYFSQNRDNNK